MLRSRVAPPLKECSSVSNDPVCSLHVSLQGSEVPAQAQRAEIPRRQSFEHFDLFLSFLIVPTAILAYVIVKAPQFKFLIWLGHITSDPALGYGLRILGKQEIRKMGGMRNLMPDLQKLKEQTLVEITGGKVVAPTLIVWGYNDPSAPVSLCFKLFEIVARGTARSQLHILNRAGHYCYREHPNEFNSLLSSFIQLS